MVTHELRVVNYELQAETLKARVGIQKCELRVTSSNSRITNWTLQVTRSNSRVMSSTLRIASSNAPVTSSNPWVEE